MRILGIVSYKGTNYQGWQKQSNAPTIQESIENVLSKFFNQQITIYGSGRTDAGVHAYAQTFHFDVNKNNVDLDRLLYSTNIMLPEDIVILSYDQVEDDFHARFSAIKKEYSYLISKLNKEPFMYDLTDVEKEPFDSGKFKEALTYFVGKHNFQNFTSKEEDDKGFIREIYSIDVDDAKISLQVTLTGSGFMRYMIRNIIGTALAYSRNKITIEELSSLIDCDDKERNIVSYKAPATGLYLNKVYY